MIRQNLHAHTTYDDGHDAPRAMVEAGLSAGLASVGLSLHSPLPFENGWAAKPGTEAAFLREMRALREAYAGRAPVYAGLEWDALSAPDFAGYDYVIGSVHYLTADGRICPVDANARATRTWLQEAFSGDADEAARLYFARVGALADVARVDIVGHFDLLTKFDERERFFDEGSPVYRAAALGAMERLHAAGKIFEINTGAISRGHRTTPYPARTLLEALARMGGRVTLSSDAHRTADVAFGLEDAAALARACGFRTCWILDGSAFVPVEL